VLNATDNETIVRTGPGTPVGELMRQYWLPAVRSDELPQPDCPPLRLRLLCEDLIAFRATSGSVGIVQNACPHRGASLFFGRNEEDGLRCVYHGWKFDASGRCVDMPSEPAESSFRDKVRARSYPTRERGGIVWAYMGPRSEPPPLPDIEPNMQPEGHYRLGTSMIDCNWSLAIENNLDQAHVIFLHYGSVPQEAIDPSWAPRISAWGPDFKWVIGVRQPQLKAWRTDYGVVKVGFKSFPEDREDYWRTMNFLMPFYTQNGVGRMGSGCWMVATVPIDDEHSMQWNMRTVDPAAAPPGPANPVGNLRPNSSDWLGRFRFALGAATDYGIDRELQRTDNTHSGYSGIRNIGDQDRAITETSGPIPDRSLEHLGTTDVLIIQVRRRVLEAAKALQAGGAVPDGVDRPAVYRQRSGWTLLPKGSDYWLSTREMRRALIPAEQAATAAVD
jgi:phenylpropionate dioxygenase-like ring-hydroxylating dioxygenase large terminal subunit